MGRKEDRGVDGERKSTHTFSLAKCGKNTVHVFVEQFHHQTLGSQPRVRRMATPTDLAFQVFACFQFVLPSVTRTECFEMLEMDRSENHGHRVRLHVINEKSRSLGTGAETTEVFEGSGGALQQRVLLKRQYVTFSCQVAHAIAQHRVSFP